MIRNKEERNAARISGDIFKKMQSLIKTVDWDNHIGVKEMKENGWEYLYHHGLVDKTEYYTRVEEDSIMFKNDKYIVQINMSSGSVVIQDKHNSGDFYAYPTIFLSMREIHAIYTIQEDIEVLIQSAILSETK